jgi:uncharacterized protein (DUF1778 family)
MEKAELERVMMYPRPGTKAVLVEASAREQRKLQNFCVLAALERASTQGHAVAEMLSQYASKSGKIKVQGMGYMPGPAAKAKGTPLQRGKALQLMARIPSKVKQILEKAARKEGRPLSNYMLVAAVVRAAKGRRTSVKLLISKTDYAELRVEEPLVAAS